MQQTTRSITASSIALATEIELQQPVSCSAPNKKLSDHIVNECTWIKCTCSKHSRVILKTSFHTVQDTVNVELMSCLYKSLQHSLLHHWPGPLKVKKRKNGANLKQSLVGGGVNYKKDARERLLKEITSGIPKSHHLQ